MLSLTSTTQLIGYEGNAGYVRNSGGTITYAPTYGVSPGVVVVYDSARRGFSYLAHGFVLPGMPVGAATPISLQLDNPRSDPTFAVYSAATSGVSFVVKQFRIGADNATLPLFYSSVAYAVTTYRDPGTGDTLTGVVPFAFGIPFEYDRVSLAGTASYDGVLVANGRAEGGTNAYDIAGKLHVDVNYATTEFSGYLDLTGRDSRTGETVSFPRIQLKPYRPRGSLDYLISALDGEGSFQANFAGAAAQEMIGGFSTQVSDPLAPSSRLVVSGTFAAKK